ncbi:hypothetical protein L7F22_004467 [Adiantum nelumboides]|nr:hypothetical protein [Adiantum nelumboides]
MRQGSLNDVDPILAAEESNLQIVPWEIRDEVSAISGPKDESNVFTHKSADILASTRLFSCFECPPIPLCRLYPYARVRGLRDDLSGLKLAFAKEGYMQEKGSFIVSFWTCQKKEKIMMTDEVTKEWDPIWVEVNEEFENELQSNPKLSDLRKYYSKGEEPWYPLTRKYLARLVYDVQMTKEYNTKVDQLSHENLSEDDLKKEQEKTYHDVTNKYNDKIGKLLNIVDPHLGSDWLVKVLSLKWGFGSWATLEKLNLIAIVDAPIQNKLLWLSLFEADNLTRVAYASHAVGVSSVPASSGAANARLSPRPTIQPIDLSSGVSQKGKEVVANTIADVLIEKAMPSSHDIGGSSRLRRVLFFNYPDDIAMHDQISHDFSRCIAITGDYIAILGDFSLGVRSPSWAMIHENMLKVIPRDLVYKRSSKSVSWAANFMFLDLPYGGLSSGYSVSPMWDRITEAHVRAGIHLTWNTLLDSRWLLIMASVAAYGFHHAALHPKHFNIDFRRWGALRGSLQRSAIFLGAFVEMLCRSKPFSWSLDAVLHLYWRHVQLQADRGAERRLQLLLIWRMRVICPWVRTLLMTCEAPIS